MKDLILKGAIPEPPTILCRDEDAALNLRHTLHEDWARKPPIFVMDEWPERWRTVNAVVVMPILVLGTDKATSFSIEGDEEIDKEARKVLNAYINLIRTSSVPSVSYRDLTRATGMDRRTVTASLKRLTGLGVGVYKYGEGFSMDIGRWVLDAEKAKAQGVVIEEY